MDKVFLIAEAASAHDGELGKALALVRLAAEVGADACKFQFWSSAERLAERRRAQEYAPLYKKYGMPAEWLPKLKAACDMNGIEFMCTCYLPEDIATVAPFVKRFKVASFEAGDDDFIAAHDPFGKPLIVSTGMLDHNAVAHLSLRHPDAAILVCVSAYPCPTEQASLGAIRSLFMWNTVGYSDHTAHPLMGALAVAAGARIIEAHIRLDDTDLQNPDYPHSLSPEKAKEYVANIRLAEKAMGDGVKKLQPCEEPMAAYRVKS